MAIPFIAPLISAVTGLFGKWQDRKATIATANAAWETAAGQSMSNGWKDEFVTVVICWPLIQTFLGNMWFAFTGNSAILDAQARSMEEIGFLLNTPYGELMYIVVLAAVGIKAVKLLK